MTQDPNVGTRDWTKFVRVSANNRPEEITYAPYTFKTSTGERPTDEWLVTDGYRGYIESERPKYQKYSQKIIVTPLTELTLQPNNVFIQTYSIANLSGNELVTAIEKHKEDINVERERRISLGCNVAVTGAGHIPIKGAPEDMRNLTNLGQAANFAIILGDTTPIPFRDDLNIIHTLTPAQMSELWRKAVTYVSMIYQASWDLKDSDPIPTDYQNDNYWPNGTI